MQISSNVPAATAAELPTGKTPNEKIGASCREFEATLWRQVLERALSPVMKGSTSAPAGSDIYTYFLSNTIAERVSGGSQGFSTMLQAQMATQAPHAHPTSTPVCTQAATH